jgi:hypothetical protein
MPPKLQFDKGLYQKSKRTVRSNFKVLKSWKPKTTSVNVQYDAEQTAHYVQFSGKNMQSTGWLFKSPSFAYYTGHLIPGPEG